MKLALAFCGEIPRQIKMAGLFSACCAALLGSSWCATTGAVEGSAGSAYWAIENNEIRYNHGRGITTGNGMYILENNVHHNGDLGIGGGGLNVCIQHNQITYNNYAGYSYYWEAGGAKFAYATTFIVEYNYSENNGGPGFWNDLNSEGITYNENATSNNIEAGILSEISTNVTISGNYIAHDAFNPSGAGIWWRVES